ncbi:MAG: DUF4091 domain-containing protein [Myxococcaceae bacterium]|nr:DUF4091 domain-containing protein [Myxococcaceae bacterium]
MAVGLHALPDASIRAKAARTEEAARREPLPWACAVSPMVKVRPGMDPGGARAWSLSLARGECEGVQIHAKPPLEQVDANVEALRLQRSTKAKGQPPTLTLRLYREAFVEVKTPSNHEGAPGLWPDPLIPVVDAYVGERRNALPFDSTAERPLVVYVEVCADGDQPEGTYAGEVVLTAKDQRPVRIALRAQVHPFTLPATSSLPTTFGISIFSIAHGHHLKADSDEGRALLRRYAQSALLHRFSLHGMSIDPPPTVVKDGVARIDWSAYDAEMGPLLEGKALPNRARFTTAEVRPNPWLKTREEQRAYLRAWREHFDQNGWTAQLFVYAKDEPKPEDRPLVLAQAEDAHSVERLPVLVTAPLDDELTPVADIVTPTLNCFYARPGPKTCPRITAPRALRQAAGPTKQVWWYQACPTHGCDAGPFDDPALERAYSGWPSYMVDHPAVLNRAMGVLDYVGGVDGELYYATVYAYNFRDPWTEGVWDFGGNGDGTLFYPGTPRHIGGKTHVPVESLRLKQLRDGLEDYEYLKLLQKLGAGEYAQKSARTLVRSGFEINRDPAQWESLRAEWTRRLDELWRRSEYARHPTVGP